MYNEFMKQENVEQLAESIRQLTAETQEYDV